MNAAALIKQLKAKGSPAKAAQAMRFFKTGPGEYGEGDVFLGLTVPEVRAAGAAFRSLPLTEIETLLTSKYHEVRLAALHILVYQYTHTKDAHEQKRICAFYVKYRRYVNNWDLVDTSAPYILGAALYGKDQTMLYTLARSKNLWERRIAMISTFYDIRASDPKTALQIAEILRHDTHDLIHKAVGWMLREIGKRCGEVYLTDFLDKYAATMPRTMLRYAIEHRSLRERTKYMRATSMQAAR